MAGYDEGRPSEWELEQHQPILRYLKRIEGAVRESRSCSADGVFGPLQSSHPAFTVTASSSRNCLIRCATGGLAPNLPCKMFTS
jgi:hypothetical protein